MAKKNADRIEAAVLRKTKKFANGSSSHHHPTSNGSVVFGCFGAFGKKLYKNQQLQQQQQLDNKLDQQNSIIFRPRVGLAESSDVNVLRTLDLRCWRSAKIRRQRVLLLRYIYRCR
jgi:L-2-hydroxyglutarate oxidase LhgO